MRSTRVILGVCLTMMVLSSCRDTAIDPFRNDNRLFTIYGYLNPLDTLQTIRIIPISRRNEELNPARESISTIEAEVYTIDMTAFTVNEWTHSIKQFPDETWGHFFTGNFPVRPGHKYRLVVSRVDGSSTTAETIVPNNADNVPIGRSEAYLDPVLGLVQDITIPGDRNIWDFQTVYRVAGGGFASTVVVPFDQPESEKTTAARTIKLPIGNDQGSVAQALAGTPLVGGEDFRSRLVGMGLLFRIVDDNWASYIDQGDEQLLARGDVGSNIRNGAGYWGSMGLLLHEWSVAPELSQALGYDN